ncbi:MAG: hypothetical protein ABSE64_00435 [Vulcanimicrobiaceae bacterium]|jgi:hypothetical protein
MRPFIIFMTLVFGGLSLILTAKGAFILLAMIAIALIAAPRWFSLTERFGLTTMIAGCIAVIIASGLGFTTWLASHGAHPIRGNCVL